MKMRAIIYHTQPHVFAEREPGRTYRLRFAHIKNAGKTEAKTYHKVVRQSPQFVVTKDRDDDEQITEDGQQYDGADCDDFHGEKQFGLPGSRGVQGGSIYS